MSRNGRDSAGVVADPDGYPLATSDLTGAEQRLQASCSLRDARNKTMSPHNDVLRDRRPELYRGLVGG